MNNIIFKSEVIKEYVYNEINKDINKIVEQDLDSITQFKLSYKDYKGNRNKYYFEDLEYFKKLKVCNFEGFPITEEIIDILNKLESLEMIIFSHCKFETDSQISSKLNKIILTYSKINNLRNFKNCKKLNKIEIIECGEINIKELIFFSELKELHIYNSKVKNSTMINSLEKLEELKLDGSLVDSPNFVQELNKKINYTYSKKYYLK